MFLQANTLLWAECWISVYTSPGCSRSPKYRTELLIAKAFANGLSPGGGCHIPYHMVGVCVCPEHKVTILADAHAWQGCGSCGWSQGWTGHEAVTRNCPSQDKSLEVHGPVKWHLLLCCWLVHSCCPATWIPVPSIASQQIPTHIQRSAQQACRVPFREQPCTLKLV